jgi:hypothetical protein
VAEQDPPGAASNLVTNVAGKQGIVELDQGDVDLWNVNPSGSRNGDILWRSRSNRLGR